MVVRSRGISNAGLSYVHCSLQPADAGCVDLCGRRGPGEGIRYVRNHGIVVASTSFLSRLVDDGVCLK